MKGFQLGDILKQRITFPPTGAAYDIQAGPAESVMKHYVRKNCIELPDMVFPFLEVAPDLQRGPSIEWQSRYKNLSEEIELISRLVNIGWHIYPDLLTKQWIFDTYNGRNLSTEQTEYPPVLFSTAFDNIHSQTMMDSVMGFRNQAVVGGQGEGAARDIIQTGSDASGLEKYVLFVDARDVMETSELYTRGEQQLKEHPHLVNLQSAILPHGPFQYEKDWDVGDLVTIQQPEWSLQLTAHITEVQEVHERDGLELYVTFGNEVPTFADRTKQNIKHLLQSNR